jgi:hypothetical protein
MGRWKRLSGEGREIREEERVYPLFIAPIKTKTSPSVRSWNRLKLTYYAVFKRIVGNPEKVREKQKNKMFFSMLTAK